MLTEATIIIKEVYNINHWGRCIKGLFFKRISFNIKGMRFDNELRRGAEYIQSISLGWIFCFIPFRSPMFINET